MVSSVAASTQTSVITTEHTLVNETTDGFYFGQISLKNMASGDTVEIRKYIKVITGATEDVFLETFVDAQSESLSTYKYFAPEYTAVSFRVTLKHTIGTTKDFVYQFWRQ
jgi:hypothetical protein